MWVLESFSRLLQAANSNQAEVAHEIKPIHLLNTLLVRRMLWPDDGLGRSGLTGEAESEKKDVDSASPSKGSDALALRHLHSYPASQIILLMQMVSRDTRLMPLAIKLYNYLPLPLVSCLCKNLLLIFGSHIIAVAFKVRIPYSCWHYYSNAVTIQWNPILYITFCELS